MIFLLFVRDYAMAACFLGLAIVFNPFEEPDFRKMSVIQKAVLIGQSLLAIALIVVALIRVAVG